jgi:hypothetical protein
LGNHLFSIENLWKREGNERLELKVAKLIRLISSAEPMTASGFLQYPLAQFLMLLDLALL